MSVDLNAAFRNGKLYVFCNENFKIVHTTDMVKPKCTLDSGDATWLACIYRIENLVYAILYEKEYDTPTGPYVYKRFGFLPEMVGKTDFLTGAALSVVKKFGL